MPTKRDKVWQVALDLRERRGSFTVSDVSRELGDDSPTRRMIRNCLNAMASLDLLEYEGGSGSSPREYFPPPPMPDGGTDSTVSQPPNNHVSTFPYPGGKGRRSEWIIDKMPPHDTYVEVFGGSGAILYNKPCSKNEVYNDINDDLTQFFTVLRERSEELAEWLQNVPYSRSLYNDWVEEFFAGERPEDPIERAGRFFALRYMQFAGDFSGPNGFKTRASRSPARSFDNARERLNELSGRFDQVIIENKDYRDILEGYDDTDVDVLFYADPPYVGAEGYYGTDFDHDEFVEVLGSVESDWMVSYSDLPETLDQSEYTILTRDRRLRMTRDSKQSTERLVCNFDPDRRAQFINSDTTQMRLDDPVS